MKEVKEEIIAIHTNFKQKEKEFFYQLAKRLKNTVQYPIMIVFAVVGATTYGIISSPVYAGTLNGLLIVLYCVLITSVLLVTIGALAIRYVLQGIEETKLKKTPGYEVLEVEVRASLSKLVDLKDPLYFIQEVGNSTNDIKDISNDEVMDMLFELLDIAGLKVKKTERSFTGTQYTITIEHGSIGYRHTYYDDDHGKDTENNN